MDTDKIYYLQFETFKRNTAAFKAPDDIYQICEKNGFHKVAMPGYPLKKGKLYGKMWLLTVGLWSWISLGRKVPKGSFVLFQHPESGKRMVLKFVEYYRKKGIQFIVLIHDLESLRGGMKGIATVNKKTTYLGDNELLKQFNAVICHNDHMKQYMISQGFDPDHLVSLQIFDYLSNVERVQPAKCEKPTICIAGNLAKVKAGYIHKLFEGGHNQNLTVNLYGTRYEPEGNTENLIYHGAFPPEDLASHLEGDFGLVWDGTEISSCAGNTGEYLRYNNPHKASMYLSAGMPVIVWSEAAIADFVLKNKVGIAVENLESLDQIIGGMDEKTYKEMANNAGMVAKQLRNGYYTINAIQEAIEKC